MGTLDSGKRSPLETKKPTGDSPPPPSYRELDQEGLISSIRKLNLNSNPGSPLPSNDECIAHLKLLSAFADLRQDTSEKDGLFGIDDNQADARNPGREQILIRIREKRWAVYVTRAVDRFDKWWHTCITETPVGTGEGGRLTMNDVLLGPKFEGLTRKGPSFLWSSRSMPPLDVLMVLHSFMLNPRTFLEDCMLQQRMPIWHAGFPWALINDCLDDNFFEYVAGDAAVQNFESKTGLSWNNLDDSPYKTIACGQCQRPFKVLYTDSSSSNDREEPFGNGTGFADKSFRVQCPACGFAITHETLRLLKFRRDVQNLVRHKAPMPGTLLSVKGIPETPPKGQGQSKHQVFFPNRLILAGLHLKLLTLTDPRHLEHQRFATVRDEFEQAIQSRGLVTQINSSGISKTLKLGEKVAVRRMMSRYWENSSPFSLDLIGAVLRQGIFVQKMTQIDWIHSPALEFTVTRLIKKYFIFFQIMGQNPGHVAVPTLDVDLAWHTQQLTPYIYYNYAVRQTNGEFIDHDDKIDENKLSTAFEWTSKRYQKIANGEIYSECVCWYCEAIRESHNTTSFFTSSNTSFSKQKALSLHSRNDISANPEKNAHISAHSAVKATYAGDMGAKLAARQQYKLQKDSAKAIRRAREAGKNPPGRDEYVYSYVWGYPMYMPLYYPYATDPCLTGNMYPSNPSCANMTPGVAGNCVAGACGGGVAAGSCAGSVGSCAGGAAGGCGGGGGGGGGGGCGGGGGGC